MMDKYQVWAHNFFEYDRISETAQEIALHPKPILYGVLIVILAGWLAISAVQKLKKPTIQRASKPDLEKPAPRTPSKFKTPERQPGGRILTRTVTLILADLYHQCGLR